MENISDLNSQIHILDKEIEALKRIIFNKEILVDDLSSLISRISLGSINIIKKYEKEEEMFSLAKSQSSSSTNHDSSFEYDNSENVIPSYKDKDILFDRILQFWNEYI